MGISFRKLKASEVDVRVATVTENGCSLLLFKDARVDQNILDESVGCLNWQRSHQLIGDRLYCTVSIWDEGKQQWISKQDVGTESYTEKEKGQASDSFKRACFNFGIGRELYTTPFIWVSAADAKIFEKNGKYTTKEHFHVSDIGYDKEGNINKLLIDNSRGQRVYNFGVKVEKPANTAEEKASPIQLKAIRAIIKKEPEKYSEEGICKYFKLKKLEDMTVGMVNTFNSMRES